MLQPASAQNCGWFSQFVPGESAYGDGHWTRGDSIPFSTRLVQQKVVNDMCCYEFEVAYKNDTRTFCVGIADSTMYTFKNNKFKNPRKLMSLQNNFVNEVKFLNQRCEAIKMDIDDKQPYYKDAVIYIFILKNRYKLFPDINIRTIFLHSTRGLSLSFSLNGEYGTYSTMGYL